MVRRTKKIDPPQDLAELDAVVERQEAGRVVHLVHMDGVSPLGFGIRIAGPDSERASAARDMMTRDRLDRPDPLAPLTREEAVTEQVMYLARISIAFDGRAVMDKRELTSTEEDFLALYLRFRFIRQQIDRAAMERADFLSGSDDS